MPTPVTNFGLVTVSTGYDASAVTIALDTGDGSRLPSTFPYPVTWWNSTDYAHPADDPSREIVLVTNRSTDTLTVTRAQEGTSASAKNTAGKTYRMSLGITKAMWDELTQSSLAHHSGLSLGTHYDSNLAATQVLLTDVDYIVMDDGEVLGNANGEWSGMVADITVSGEGGRDAGSEVGGALYDIYAIAKNDGTRNLLLHRAAVDTIGPIQASLDTAQPIRSTTSNERVAQGFQLSTSGAIPHVDLWLEKVGSPTGRLTVIIDVSSGGNPANSGLATSYEIDVSRLQNSLKNVRIPMKLTANFSASTQYHIVVIGNWTINGTDYVAWHMKATGNPYSNGVMATYNSGTDTWTQDADADMAFTVYIRMHDSAVSLPSGYTKKRHLGYVSNAGGGGSDFIPFQQVGRSMKFTRAMARLIQNETIAGPQRYDLGNTGLLPSRNGSIRAHVALTGTGAAVATYALGDWRSTDISSSTGVGAALILHAPLTDEIPCAYGSLDISHVCIMGQGTSGADLYLVGFDW